MLNERNKYQQGHVVTIIVLVYFLLCDIYNRKIADQNKEGSCNPQNEHGPEKNDLKAGIQRERERDREHSLTFETPELLSSLLQHISMCQIFDTEPLTNLEPVNKSQPVPA